MLPIAGTRACTRAGLIVRLVIDEASVGDVERVLERELQRLERCCRGFRGRDRGIRQIGGNDYPGIGSVSRVSSQRTGNHGVHDRPCRCAEDLLATNKGYIERNSAE